MKLGDKCSEEHLPRASLAFANPSDAREATSERISLTTTRLAGHRRRRRPSSMCWMVGRVPRPGRRQPQRLGSSVFDQLGERVVRRRPRLRLRRSSQKALVVRPLEALVRGHSLVNQPQVVPQERTQHHREDRVNQKASPRARSGRGVGFVSKLRAEAKRETPSFAAAAFSASRLELQPTTNLAVQSPRKSPTRRARTVARQDHVHSS